MDEFRGFAQISNETLTLFSIERILDALRILLHKVY